MKGINKRLILIILAAVIVITAGVYFPAYTANADPSADGLYGINLLYNGDFSLLDENGMPEGWKGDYYKEWEWKDQPSPIFEVTEDGVSVENPDLLDARFAQRVVVEPNALYLLTGKIRADAQGGQGANLSVEGVLAYSASVYQSGDEWQEVALYGRTGEDQNEINVFVRLGGYGNESTGKAWFKDISLVRIETAPQNANVYPFFIPQPFNNAEIQEDYSESEFLEIDQSIDQSNTSPFDYDEYGYAPYNGEKNEYNKNAVNQLTENGSGLILFFCLFFVLLFLCIKDRFTQLPSPENKPKDTHWKWLVLLLAIALAARIYAALNVSGYIADMTCFNSWAHTMKEFGPNQFYNTASFCDYPPGYLYVLWAMAGIGDLMGGLTETMLKIPSIVCDMFICLLLYTEGKKRQNSRCGLLLAAFWALNPVSFVAGACWGQVDSLLTLLLLLSIIFIFRKQWKAALPLYVLAVLVKPQALMFGPMGVAALILHLKNNKFNKKSLLDLLFGFGISVVVFLALVMPFIAQISPVTYLEAKGFEAYEIQAKLEELAQNPSITEMEGYTIRGGSFADLINGLKFVFSLYGKTMGSYDYVTVNACNLYFLMDLNWVFADTPMQNPVFTGMLILLLCNIPAIIGTYRAGKLRLNNYPLIYTAFLFFAEFLTIILLYEYESLSYSTLGTLVIIHSVVLCIGLFLLRGEMKYLPVYAAAMLMMLFSCGTMMHERYLLPVIILMLIGFATTKDKRLLYLMALTAVASFINMACVLERNLRIGNVFEAHLNKPLMANYCSDQSYGQSDLYILEYLSAGLTMLSSVLCLYLATAPKCRYKLPEAKPLQPFKVNKLDVILILVVSCLYAVPAFVNLGSTTSPQRAWTSINKTETLTLDLGGEKEFTIQYFGGIHLGFDGRFTLVTESESGTRDQRYCSILEGQCFQWQNVPGTFKSRYIHLTADNDKVMLFEIIFRDAKTGAVIPAKFVSSSNNNPTAVYVCDEPYTMGGTNPSWYNSTYFDEIYHARTAYEHLHGLQTYETSHPPLGKVLMSWAIAIFGMTPFGWRFAGALAGLLMLPGMYLLGKMLSKNKWGGLFAMLMMAFDTMHFTQTRIATIDSFAVLFIIWSIYFMLRWFRMENYFQTPFWKTLLPLFLSGIFMGLSIASKWTGFYNVVALAVIFFWGFVRRMQEWLSARKEVKQYQQELENYNIRKLNAPKKPSKKKNTVFVSPRIPEQSISTVKNGYVLPATIGLCILFFIVIPLLIYYLSYIPYFAYDGGVTVEKVIQAAVGDFLKTGEINRFSMLGYHSTPGLGMDHPYYSPWYEWPVIAEPMYYYGHGYGTTESTCTIMLLGNPAVWWSCLIGLAAFICIAIYRHIRFDIYKYENPGTDLRCHAFHITKPWDFRYGLLLICFLAQYLPWVLVPRGTYIYHYFTSVPFIILCTGVVLDKLHERKPIAALILGGLLLTAALALFIAFFPYASGITVSRDWLNAMAWFDNWIYY